MHIRCVCFILFLAVVSGPFVFVTLALWNEMTIRFPSARGGNLIGGTVGTHTGGSTDFFFGWFCYQEGDDPSDLLALSSI